MKTERRADVTYRSGRGFTFRGSPVSFVLALLVLAWLVLLAYTVVKYTLDRHGAYEGTVLEIQQRWFDYLTFEMPVHEHLIIQSPDGDIVDRYVSIEVRALGNIMPGDYVIKEEGFGNVVRPRDHKTGPELMEEYGLKSEHQ